MLTDSNNCYRCNGTGTYMGNGMMKAYCELCSEDKEVASPSLEKVDRKSASYKSAIKDIMAINKDISRKQAVEMFDKAYSNK